MDSVVWTRQGGYRARGAVKANVVKRRPKTRVGSVGGCVDTSREVGGFGASHLGAESVLKVKVLLSSGNVAVALPLSAGVFAAVTEGGQSWSPPGM